MLAQQSEGDLVLLQLDQGTYFALNEVGARVWQLCDGNRTVDEVIDVIVGEFEAPRDLVVEDVTGLLHDLASDSLVTL